MKHITVNQTGGSPDNFKAAFIRALQETVESEVREILILVPQKSNLEHGDIENVLGRAVVKKLLKNESVTFSDFKVSIRARTLRTIEMTPKSEVIIGAYLTPPEFEGIIAMSFDAVAAIYVPWMDAELEAWMLKNPELIDVPSYIAQLNKKG